MGLNNIEVKRLNRNLVLRYMLKTEQVSKSSIAQALHLSVPTVTQCLNDLKEFGLVREEGTMESIGGRKSMGFQSVRDAKMAVGVDITRNHVNLAVIDLGMDLLHSKRVAIRLHDNASSYEKLHKIIKDFIIESQTEQEQILGLGVSLPAIVDDTGTRLISMHEQMNISRQLYQIIKQWFPYPVTLVNDADSAGRAEFKIQESEKDTVFFFVSPSVGGTVIIDRKPVFGRTRRAGEFGHMTLVPGGKPCYCGRKGCVNAYCSTEILSEKTDGHLETFFTHLDNKEEEYVKLWEEYLDYLAISIHNLMSSFDMEMIIGGYLGKYIGNYMDQLEVRIKKCDSYVSDIHFIKPASLKYEASAIGAADVFVEAYINSI